MIPSKNSRMALLVGMAFLMAACSGLKSTTTGGSGTGTGGSYTIGGSISGLTGTGLVLVDTVNGKTPSSQTITAGSTKFTFTTQVPSGDSYAVTVQTQPTNPAQTCAVTAGTGTVASANVTTVAIACTTNAVTATIGGTLSGLASGGSVILQDNGGDALTLTANGPFTFKTPVTGPTDAYAVTVNTQPTSPLQICTVANGSGTASANVTNVAVTCVLAYTIGGNLTGLVGTGFILEDTVTMGSTALFTEQLPITLGSGSTGNAAFTFKDDVPTGATYTVSVAQQPTGPVQTCVVTPSTATGTATANVISVVVTCPAVTYSVGGTVYGLEGVLPNNGVLTDNSFVEQNNAGDNVAITQNGPFTFPTPVALNGAYNAQVFTPPSSQAQPCWTYFFKGVVTGNVTSIVIDCGHNDWAWINGSKTAGTEQAPQYGMNYPITPILNPFTNTPGARDYGAGWTDAQGNMWLFGGYGWELQGNSSPATLPGYLNDLWVCPIPLYSSTGDQQCQWQLATNPSNSVAWAENEDNPGLYGTQGVSANGNIPGGRWGAATWTDQSGNLWLFGGIGIDKNGANGLLNDLWMFGPTNSSGSPTGQWTWVGGSNVVDQGGTYTGTEFPGARWGAVYFTDQSGNFWMFGGYGYDSNGNVGWLNDLWEYNGTAWTFLSGSTTVNQDGVYGTQGTAGANNVPGGRQSAVGWADLSGNLWIFGGEGEDSAGTASGILNDLWMFNIKSKQWTWVTGSNIANQTGTYELQPLVGPVSTTGAAGTCGLPVGNAELAGCPTISTTGAGPGSRWGATAWTDAGGNLWLFGGWGLDSTATNGNGFLNDMWVYTPNAATGQPGTWNWVKGSNSGNANGNYPTSTVRPDEPYVEWIPGARRGATGWVDKSGNFWLFGGQGYDSTSTNGNGYLNDQWRYVPYPD